MKKELYKDSDLWIAEKKAILSDEEKNWLNFFYLNEKKLSMKKCFLLMKKRIPKSHASYRSACRYLQQLPPVVGMFYRNSVKEYA